MNFIELLASFEASGVSIWARESEWAFFLFLIIHSLALGVVVGSHVAFNLRILGVAKSIPLFLMKKLMLIMWPGVLVAVLSGAILLIAYPAKALTNPVFYLKLGCIVVALTIYQKVYLRHSLLDDKNNRQEESSSSVNNSSDLSIATLRESKLKPYAVLNLLLWTSSIFAGRFLAYTHSVLLASDYF